MVIKLISTALLLKKGPVLCLLTHTKDLQKYFKRREECEKNWGVSRTDILNSAERVVELSKLRRASSKKEKHQKDLHHLFSSF